MIAVESFDPTRVLDCNIKRGEAPLKHKRPFLGFEDLSYILKSFALLLKEMLPGFSGLNDTVTVKKPGYHSKVTIGFLVYM